jgi:hypothetical protein
MFLTSRAARLTLAGVSVLAVGLATTPASAAGSTTLKDRVEKTVQAGGKANYDFTLPGSFWAAVAVRPDAGVTTDLKVYAEPSRETVLARSSKPGKAINFVAIDAGAFPSASFYPTVKSTGAGNYVIELDKGSLQMLDFGTPITFTMNGSDVVRTISIVAQHNPGQQYKVTLTPSDDDQDGAIYVMDNVFNLEDPYLGSKDAVASANAKGPGGAEKLTFVAGNSQDEYGIVITNLAGSGSYTVKMTQV